MILIENWNNRVLWWGREDEKKILLIDFDGGLVDLKYNNRVTYEVLWLFDILFNNDGDKND